MQWLDRTSDRWRIFDINCGLSDAGCWCCTFDSGALCVGDGLVLPCPIQSAKAADAIKSNRGFSGLRKPFGTQREERQGPKIAAHFLYEQGRQVPWYLRIKSPLEREVSWFFSPDFTKCMSPSLQFVVGVVRVQRGVLRRGRSVSVRSVLEASIIV